ncbi:MAG: beta-N-acetylhexosaminidase [Gammaproteobacteria bacterium]|nr:MAG: beta-N-acetylhexosaminidase [Gammaproteobacteria bacterium]
MIPDTAIYLFGLQGKALNAEETAWLQHPLCAGVILFTRNFDNPAQIRAFIQTLRATAGHDILIAVDHEGGRVQRFRNGFTAIPAMATLGQRYEQNPNDAKRYAGDLGYVMAYEIGDCDIDFSFAPVLDVQTDFSEIIGDRGFHHNVAVIAELAGAFYQGMRQAGTIGVGKHFPGHGNVVADSHLTLPVCEADFATLTHRDLPPFKALIQAGIEAIMPAHILYTQVDGMPAGFSTYWLQSVLRQQLGFDGCIISDDLDMAGAAAYGDMPARIELAAHNCDLILLCNNAEGMRQAFNSLTPQADAKRQARLTALKRDKTRHDGETYQRRLARVCT